MKNETVNQQKQWADTKQKKAHRETSQPTNEWGFFSTEKLTTSYE